MVNRFFKRILNPPSVGLNLVANKNYQQLKKLLLDISPNPKILFIGSGEKIGKGVKYLGEEILNNAIKLDIAKARSVNIIADAHKLPFLSSKFDGIAVQGVFQYLKSPVVTVDEIYRVLRNGGYVYIEVPFFQPYRWDIPDRWRFTLLGLEELFSKFYKIKSGVCSGPTSSFLHILIHYLIIIFSFNNLFLRNMWFTVFRWIFFPIKYIDLLLKKSKWIQESACGFYYIGRKISSYN